MKKFMFILVLGLFVFPSNVKAICYNKDKLKLSKIASNVSSSYEYFDDANTFDITLTNLRNGFIVKEVKTNNNFNYSQDELTFKGYMPGGSYRFDIYTTLNNCGNNKLYSLYITLPIINNNYKDPLCNGLENYDICQKWGKYINDYDEFGKQVNEIKKEINEENIYTEEAEYLGFFDHVALLFINYYYIILPIIIVGGIITIYGLNKKNKLF